MANAFGTNPNNSLENALRTGAAGVQSGVNAAQNGVNVVLNGGAQVRADTAGMRDQARLVNTQAGRVNDTADALAALAGMLAPDADALRGYGDTLWKQGNSMFEQSRDQFGQAGALASLDPNATGLAGEFIKQYGYMSPDKYVSRATSDTQSAFDNALAQQSRELARRGVGVGSGAAQALRQQLSRAKAVALAAMKTNARQQGIDEQTKMLSTMTGAAKTFFDMGKDSAQTALDAQKTGAGLREAAAGVTAKQGDILQNAGAMREAVGNLFAKTAGILGDAAAAEMNWMKLADSAWQGVADAWKSAAEYYNRAASTEVSANTAGGGGGGTHGVQFAHIGFNGEVLRPGAAW